MQHIYLLCVGNLKERWLRDACEEYAKRMTPFCSFEIIEVAEERMPDKPSLAQIENVLKKEGERLLSRLPKGADIVAMCVEGERLSSEGLSEFIGRSACNGAGHLAFAVGGSWGLSPEVKKKAAFKLSMSAMTFPHQLTRVMLCEQIYRAFKIQTGGKYHK